MGEGRTGWRDSSHERMAHGRVWRLQAECWRVEVHTPVKAGAGQYMANGRVGRAMHDVKPTPIPEAVNPPPILIDPSHARPERLRRGAHGVRGTEGGRKQVIRKGNKKCARGVAGEE